MVKVATPRQKRLAKEIVLNAQIEQPLNTTQLLEKVGYRPNTAKHKQKTVIEAEGVQNELKALGFDEDTAKKVVGSILKDESNEPKDRLKAAEQVFKVHGSYAAEKHINVSLQVSKDERDKILGISSKVREQMTHEEING